MDIFNIEIIGEIKLAELLPLWKSYNEIHQDLQSESLGAEILLRWIVNSVEFRLKREALLNTRAKNADVQHILFI